MWFSCKKGSILFNHSINALLAHTGQDRVSKAINHVLKPRQMIDITKFVVLDILKNKIIIFYTLLLGVFSWSIFSLEDSSSKVYYHCSILFYLPYPWCLLFYPIFTSIIARVYRIIGEITREEAIYLVGIISGFMYSIEFCIFSRHRHSCVDVHW